MNSPDTGAPCPDFGFPDAEELNQWAADVLKDGPGCADGLTGITTPEFRKWSESYLPLVMLRLTLAMEEQNRMMLALVQQTAALVEILVETQPADDGEPTTYLDGSKVQQ